MAAPVRAETNGYNSPFRKYFHPDDKPRMDVVMQAAHLAFGYGDRVDIHVGKDDRNSYARMGDICFVFQNTDLDIVPSDCCYIGYDRADQAKLRRWIQKVQALEVKSEAEFKRLQSEIDTCKATIVAARVMRAEGLALQAQGRALGELARKEKADAAKEKADALAELARLDDEQRKLDERLKRALAKREAKLSGASQPGHPPMKPAAGSASASVASRPAPVAGPAAAPLKPGSAAAPKPAAVSAAFVPVPAAGGAPALPPRPVRVPVATKAMAAPSATALPSGAAGSSPPKGSDSKAATRQ